MYVSKEVTEGGREGGRKRRKEGGAFDVNIHSMNLPPLALRQTAPLFVRLLLLLAQGQVVHLPNRWSQTWIDHRDQGLYLRLETFP
jgi:hypothetical protein